MNYYIDRENGIPAYIQLYRCIVKDISAGIYPYGSRLPSKRIIAADNGVSLITAEHALNLLLEEGYIESRQRSGYFVVYRSPLILSQGNSRAKSASAPGSDTSALDLLSGSNSKGRTGKYINGGASAAGDVMPLRKGDFPYTVLSKTMRRVILDYGDRILVRSPNQGCPELRQEISSYLARSRGIKAGASQIVIGSGAEYLYGLAAQLIGKETVFGIEFPSYAKIRQVYESMGIRCDLLRMSDEGIDSSELERTDAGILHVTPFNSYPSGITAGISKRLEYLNWAQARKGVLIEDNYDSELTISKKPEEPLFSMAENVDVIYINTFSKTIAPSMRIGYMVLPAGLTDRFTERLGFYSCTVPVFEQYVLAELLSCGDFERHINRVRRRKRREARDPRPE